MQQSEKQEHNKSVYDPARSIFVSANAGSGKTSLLVERVLSLLMHGVPPSKILCLTFTNNAAAEMNERITQILGCWVMMEEEALTAALEAILPQPVTPALIARARGLFAKVLDAPVGLRLQTIHGFCQSLLARFPLEAGVGLHLSVMDDATRQILLKEARMQLFSSSSPSLREGMYLLVQQLGEYSLLELLAEMVAQKRKLSRFIAEHHGIEGAVKAIYKMLGISEADDFAALCSRYMSREGSHLSALRDIASLLATTAEPTNQATAKALTIWLEKGDESAWKSYSAQLLVEGRPRKTLYTKKAPLSLQQAELLAAEQEQAASFVQCLRAWQDAQFSANLLSIGGQFIAHYDRLKEQRGLMDFDDQILAAQRLLSSSHVSAWVMYKLDGGIDHVLVDEAQDTSPEQWEIVRAITSEFFAGKGRQEGDRSLFVVGDEKQSIFRFQGADPAGLATNRQYFLKLLDAAQMPAHQVSRMYSYRSAPEILSLVDTVFAHAEARAGLSSSGDAIQHQAKRVNAAGYCELWPLTMPDEAQHRSAEYQLAQQLATQVAAWVKTGVSAGDIMVLVRRRTAFVQQLSRALKRRNIPVAGVDRMNLLDHIAVQDLLAFAQILLLPEDDLTLASLLKSPLFHWSEEALFAHAHARKSSLWQEISGSSAHALLVEFRSRVDFLSPYALFAELLEARGFRRAFSGRMGEEVLEILDMFLEQALQYEQSGPPSMQGFISWMQSGESEMKRDMEQSLGKLRIMTVHASKGLQAKIVILADSTTIPSLQDRIQWNDFVLLSSRNAENASGVLQQLRQSEKVMEMEEYRRLLYVALTRAEDMLLVCGAFSGKSRKEGVQEGSWYRLAEAAFTQLGQREPDGRIRYGTMPVIMRQEPAILPAPAAVRLFGDALPEAAQSHHLAPSESYAAGVAEQSFTNDAMQLSRGVALHRLLQHLPTLPPSVRHAQGIALAERYAPQWEAELLLAEAMRVMELPETAPLFSADGLPEVAVAGMVEWQGEQRHISGRIDRLCISDQSVWVIDYKSTLSPPASPPAAYVTQLALYATLLQQIYPKHHIRTGLLWTCIPRLDEVMWSS